MSSKIGELFLKNKIFCKKIDIVYLISDQSLEATHWANLFHKCIWNYKFKKMKMSSLNSGSEKIFNYIIHNTHVCT